MIVTEELSVQAAWSKLRCIILREGWRWEVSLHATEALLHIDLGSSSNDCN